MILDHSMKPKRKSHARHRFLKEWKLMIVYDPKIPTVHAFNPLGGLVWELCDGHHTIEDISHEICAIFNVPKDIILKDINSFIELLIKNDLIDFSW